MDNRSARLLALLPRLVPSQRELPPLYPSSFGIGDVFVFHVDLRLVRNERDLLVIL